MIVIETPSVQDKVCSSVMTSLEEAFDAKVSCDGIRLKPFNALVIDNLLILDEKYSPADTFARIGHLSATLSVWGLLYGEGVHLGRLRMKDIDFHLITEFPKDSAQSSNLQRIFRLKKAETKETKAGPQLFDIRRARADGLRFRLTSLIADSSRYKGRGINYADLDARASFKAHRISFGGGLFKASVDELKLAEKSGYKNAIVRGRLRVGLGKTLIENLRIKDAMSDVRMSHFAMNYENARSFSKFVDEVSFDAVFDKTVIDYSTIQAFAYQLPHCRLKAKIKEGTVNGPVNDLRVEDLVFTDLRSSVNGTVSCHLIGVADSNKDKSAPNFAIDASVRNLLFTGSSITTFLRYYAPKLNFNALVPGHNYKFNGKCTGYLQKMNVLGNFTSSGIGGFGTNLQIRNAADKARPIELSGSIYADKFNLGEALGKDKFGECSMHSAMRASFAKGNSSIIIDSLSVTKLGFLGYDYSGIGASGRFDGSAFDGKISVNDPNLKFVYEGSSSIPGKDKDLKYIFDAALEFANLSALNLDKRNEASFAALKISSIYRHSESGNDGGKIKISDIRLGNENGIKEVGDISCDISGWNGNHSLKVKSDFADMDFKGEQDIFTFLSDLTAVSLNRHLPSLKPSYKQAAEFSSSRYSTGIRFHDSRNLLSFAAPGLYIADSSKLSITLDDKGLLEMNLSSPRIAAGKNYIKQAEISGDNMGDGLRLTLSNQELKYAGLLLKDCYIDCYAKNDSLATNLKYESANEENSFGELFLNAYFSRSPSDSLKLALHTLPSTIKTLGSTLDIHESRITIGEGKIHIDSLEALLNNRKIALSGGLSLSKKDSLCLDIDSLDLNLLSKATASSNEIKGFLSGHAYINSPIETTESSNLEFRVDSLVAGGYEYGLLQIKGGWSKEDQSMKVSLNGVDEDSVKQDISANWKPETGLEINADMKHMNVALVQPFIKSGISGLTGYLNGKINARLKKGALKITSEDTSAENLEVTLLSTGVHYKLNGGFSITDKTLTLNKMKVEDMNSGSGEVNGSLDLSEEKNILVDASVKTSGIEVLNIEHSFDKDLCGHLKTRADLTIKGSMDELDLEGNVGTVGNSSLYIATGKANAVKASDLLSFKKKADEIDPYLLMVSSLNKSKKKAGKLNLKLQTSINPGTEIIIELDKNSGNGIVAYGKGTIGIDLQSRTGKLNLTGDYAIDRGKFHFEIPGIVNKDFSISTGSRVKLNGDVPNSELDIKGVYNMKTSLSTLIADSTSSGRRPVECIIGINGKLSNPKIDFDVNVPDLDPTTRNQVEAALNTDDKKQKQFMALLVMGSFLPSEQSGVVNSSNVLYSNVSEIMSGQLNGILQKLNIPLDLGVGYQQSSAGKNMFDVAVSTQLFNNRVIVDGTVANRQYKTSGNTASVVGDVNIEVKLDRPGNFRLKLFSHSADEHTSFLDYSQRNGVGVSIQKEFDNLPDLFKNLFQPAKKRERNKLEELEKNKQKIKMTIE